MFCWQIFRKLSGDFISEGSNMHRKKRIKGIFNLNLTFDFYIQSELNQNKNDTTHIKNKTQRLSAWARFVKHSYKIVWSSLPGLKFSKLEMNWMWNVERSGKFLFVFWFIYASTELWRSKRTLFIYSGKYFFDCVIIWSALFEKELNFDEFSWNYLFWSQPETTTNRSMNKSWFYVILFQILVRTRKYSISNVFQLARNFR